MSSQTGASDAKAQPAQSQKRAELTEALCCGHATAQSISDGDASQSLGAAAASRLRALRQDATLGDLDWRALRDTGRH